MEGIITCMTCMFAVALAMGGPIRRQASQSEETVPIGGNVTLLCPFVPDATWVWVYWKKNEHTIYSLQYQNNNPWVNDTRYEGSNHATRFTIKDLQKTDSGIYYCKVATSDTTDFIKEGGQVLLSVTDQEIEYSTTYPDVPFGASTAIPPQPAEDKAIFVALVCLTFIQIIFIMGLVYKYRQRVKNLLAGFVSPFRRLVTRCSSTFDPDSPHCEIRDEVTRCSSMPLDTDSLHCDTRYEATRCSSTRLDNEPTHCDTRDEANILVATRCSSTPLDNDSTHCDTRDEANILVSSETGKTGETGETGVKQLPLVGPVLIDDYCASAINLISVEKRMKQVLHFLVEKYKGEGVPPKGGEYSASLRKYASSGNRFVPKDVLKDVEYFLDELDHIPVGRKRDICEILLTMPEILEVDTFTTYLNKDIFWEYDQDDKESAVKREHTSRTKILQGQMRSILRESETRDAARNYISLIIVDAPVETSGSASLSQQAASRSANDKEQETGFLSQTDEDSKREEDNLIEFWLSKVIKLDPAVQRKVSDRFDDLYRDAGQGKLPVGVCELCDKLIFEEDIPLGCVHIMFCRRCLEKYGLHDDRGHMVRSLCSGNSDSRNPQWDFPLDILRMMYLRAKCRRGLLENCDDPDVNLLCHQLNKVLNESTSSSTPKLPGSQPTSKGGTKPCLRSGYKTCNLVRDVTTVTGPHGNTMVGEGNFTC